MTKRRKIALLALAGGILAVAAAVVLMMGFGNGYEKAFEAFEKLAFEADNYTVHTDVSIRIGDIEVENMSNTYLTDRGDYAKVVHGAEDGKPYSEESYKVGNTTYIQVDHENKTYSTYVSDADSMAAPVLKSSDDADKAAFRLIKLAADFLSGNIKNQFSASRMEGGRRYSVSLSEPQLPEAAKILMEIFNAANIDAHIQGLDYEDSHETFRAHYRTIVQSELPEDFFDIYYENDALYDAYRALKRDMDEKYEALLAPYDENGYVFIEKDGSANAYPSIHAFYKSLAFQEENLHRFGLDAFMKSIHFENAKGEVDILDSGMFSGIRFTLTLQAEDYAGVLRPMVIKCDIALSDYGATEIALPDFSGYTRDKNADKFYVIKTREIMFHGKTYTVEYRESVEE